MFDKGYFITAELRVKEPENTAKAVQSLKALCTETLKEPGCSIFTLHQCASDERRFLLWERFGSEEDFKRHFELAHTQAYLKEDLTEVVQYFVSDIV